MFPALKRSGLAVLLAVGCWCAASAAAGAESKMLQWKFTPGTKAYYRIVNDADANFEGGPQKFKVKSSQTSDVTWDIVAVDEQGTADIISTIDRVQIRATGGPGGTIDYDSDAGGIPEGPSGAVAVFYENFVNQPIRLKMDSTGKISDIVLPEKLARLIKNASASPGGAALSEDAVKQMFGAGFVQFAKKPVSKGDHWQLSRTVNIPPMGKQDQTATYEYLGPVQRNGQTLEKVGLAIKIEIPGEEGAPKFEIEEQQSAGAFEFDLKAGRIADLKLDSMMKSKFTFNGTTFSQDGKTSIKITPLAPPKSASEKPAEGEDGEK